jgi:hypothetical protein
VGAVKEVLLETIGLFRGDMRRRVAALPVPRAGCWNPLLGRVLSIWIALNRVVFPAWLRR